MSMWTMIPQHYPLWVEEQSSYVRDGDKYMSYTYIPIIGWTMKNENNNAYLHPVVANEVGAVPYDGTNWEIVDNKRYEE